MKRNSLTCRFAAGAIPLASCLAILAALPMLVPGPAMAQPAGVQWSAVEEEAESALGPLLRDYTLTRRHLDATIASTRRGECVPDEGDGGCHFEHPLLGTCGAIHSCAGSERWPEVLASILLWAERAPGSEYIVGQAVYALGSIGRWDQAAQSLERCAAVEWWCESLRAYVTVRGGVGNAELVEARLDRALEAMPNSERCAWTQVGPILEHSLALVFRRLDCAQKEEWNARTWWLADPLLSVPGNERRVEHLVRAIEARIITDLRTEGRTWKGSSGGPIETSGSGWTPRDADDPLAAHVGRGAPDSWSHLVMNDPEIRPARGWVSMKSARYSLIPKSEAVREPLLSSPDHWEIERGFFVPADDHHDAFTPPSGLKLLGMDWQAVTFERGEEMLVLVAGDVPTEASGPERLRPVLPAWGPKTGALVLMSGPDRVDADVRDPVDRDRYVLATTVPPGRYLAGLEVLAIPRLAGRVRGSIGPPSDDEVPESNVVRASIPLLFTPVQEAGSAIELPPVDEVGELAGILGAPRVRAGDRVAVYWEMYGPLPDPVTGEVHLSEVSSDVTVELRNEGGLFGWLRGGTSVHAESVQLGAVGTLWGLVRRAVELDSSELEPGSYELTLRMLAEGRDAVLHRVSLVVE